MKPLTVLISLLVGNQIITSIAVVSNSKRTVSHAKSHSLSVHRVVFQVNVEGQEPWLGILGNVENLLKAFGAEHTQIEVVCFGKGIDMLLKTNTAQSQRLETVSKSGVVFAACQNTMRVRKIAPGDLLPFVITVDSGVAEIVRKQEAGWSYIKGG